MGNRAMYEIVIEPNRNWLRVDWRGLVQYRDLFYLLVRREFVVKYKQTMLGPLWAVVQSLLTSTVFVIIFARVARVPTDGVPAILFYLGGLLAWSYFAQSLNAIAMALRVNSALLSKVYFPRLIVPLAMMTSNLIPFAIQLVVFLAFYGYFRLLTPAGAELHTGPAIWALPLLVLQAAALSLGAGLLAASLTVRYRDLSQIIPFLLQIGLYATPIIYPLSLVSERWRPLIALNPMSIVVESMRSAFFGTPAPEARFIALSILATGSLLLAGLLLFNRVERTFVDTI